MKLHNTHTHESTMTTQDTGTFSIAVNGKAFSILLDGLYTNKIRAVVRELWTNAYDSHLDAGIGGIPFDVHLPTRMDPSFRVRDYGVSLSHADVMGLYTTLFDSTKDDSNDVVGALGLGSKSPFAYTDTFTVVARLDGRKRTYLAAIGGDGTPTITLLADVESDEAQGLEVSIAARVDDFHEFESEARSLAIGFDPVPAVDGIELETVVPAFVASDASFAVFAPRALPTDSAVWIRQGCVIYPVSESGLMMPIRRMLNWGYSCVINVPIGAVGIVASREGLSLDDETREAVTAAVEKTAVQMQAEIDNEIKSKPTLLAALEYWNGGAAEYRKVFSFHPSWRGERLTAVIPLAPFADGSYVKAKVGNRKGTSEIRGISFSNRDDATFVLRRTDTPVKRAMTRYRDAVIKHGGNDSGIYLLVDPTKAELDHLRTSFGLKPTQFVKIENLLDNGPNTRSGVTSGRVTGVYSLDGRYYHNAVAAFDPTIDYTWFEIDRISQNAVNATYAYRENAQSIGVNPGTTYMFTSGAIKRYKPDAKRGLVNMVAAKRDGLLPGWKKTFTAHLLLSEIGSIADLVGLDKTAVLPTDKTNQIHRHMPRKDMAECVEAATAEADKIKAKYPLLFDRYDTEAIKAYIVRCDADSE